MEDCSPSVLDCRPERFLSDSGPLCETGHLGLKEMMLAPNQTSPRVGSDGQQSRPRKRRATHPIRPIQRENFVSASPINVAEVPRHQNASVRRKTRQSPLCASVVSFGHTSAANTDKALCWSARPAASSSPCQRDLHCRCSMPLGPSRANPTKDNKPSATPFPRVRARGESLGLGLAKLFGWSFSLELPHRERCLASANLSASHSWKCTHSEGLGVFYPEAPSMSVRQSCLHKAAVI